MSISVLFSCDQASVPRSIARRPWDKELEIRRLGGRDLTLRIENVSHALGEQLSTIATDLIHIAAYVYAADQLVNRIHRTDVFGDEWRREMHLCVPVSDPDFWSASSVESELNAVLGFATQDSWSFSFSAHRVEDEQLIFSGAGADLLNRPTSVFLFSGGADSLGAVVEEVFKNGGRPVLVSHRSVSVTDNRQQALRSALVKALPQWEYPQVSIWAHRRGSDPNDSSQRARSFLFACLAASMATSLELDHVALADNGIVSLNIPTTQQIVGARASRSTHPKFLFRMNQFLGTVFPNAPFITNPLWSRTRPEVMRILRDASVPHLLQQSHSCSHWTRRPSETPHCGVCSQCIDRRFAGLAAGMAEFDTERQYKKDIFRGPLEGDPADEIKQAASYVSFARRINGFLSDDELFNSIRELDDCILPSDPNPDATMLTLISMLRRHATGVLAVLSEQIKSSSDDLAAGRLPPTCLVSLSRPVVIGRPLTLKLQSPPLTEADEKCFVAIGFRSRLSIHISGAVSGKKSNVVLVDGTSVHLDDADFILFLRLVLQLWLRKDGFLRLEDLRFGEGDDSEESLIPRGWQQALGRLRKNFRGRVGSLTHLEFIENGRGKVRISTHPKYLMVGCEALITHDNEKVRRLAQRIKDVQSQRGGPD